MAGRVDPPHERVRLTSRELQTVAALDRMLADDGTGRRSSSWAGRWRKVGRWLFPIAVVLVVVMLAISVAVGVLGR